MVVFSNVLLILVSLAGLTTAGLLEGLFRSEGGKNNSALGGGFGAALGKGLLQGILGGVSRASKGEKVDPALASVLSQFSQDFNGNTGTNSAGNEAGAGSTSTAAGSSGAQREPDSSEEGTKPRGANVGGPLENAAEKPGSKAPKDKETPQQPAPGQSAHEISAKQSLAQPGPEKPATPTSASSGLAGGANTDAVQNVGAVAGAALAGTLFTAIADAIKRKREQRRKKLGGQGQTMARREKRSLADDMGLIGAKGALRGLNHVPDFSNSFYCGRHEMPNTVGAQDRFCHPSATWNTTLRLLPDCVCQPGFLRNSWGECISAMECNLCRSKHRFNMDYHVCGSPCPIVCNQRVNEYCPNTCVRKCACRPGYIRKYPNGPCVSLKECLPGCRGRNQIFSLCSSLCPPTCRRPVPKRCPKICAGEGCVCKPGFVVKTWEPLLCVRPERCPGRRRKCKGPNQVFTRCRRRCPPSCFRRGRNRYCGKECIGRGCVCKRGFVVLQWRPLVCVRPNQCPKRRKTCPAKNQIYKYCKSKCPPTCADKKPRKCGAACSGEGCACKPGFVIKQHNPLICVRRSRCRFSLKRPNRGNVRRRPRPNDPFPWSSFPNEF